MVTKLNHQVFCSCSTDNIQNWRTEPSRAAQYKTTPEYVVKNRLRRELQHQTRTEVCGRLFGMVCPLFCGMFSVVSDRGALGVVPRNLWCGPGSTERSARGGHWPSVHVVVTGQVFFHPGSHCSDCPRLFCSDRTEVEVFRLGGLRSMMLLRISFLHTTICLSLLDTKQ